MVQNRGNSIPYSTGTTGRPLPTHDPRSPLHTGQQAARKPTGLDWDAHTPTCIVCGQKSGQLDKTDLCPACRNVLPTTPPTVEAAVGTDSTTYPRYDAEQLARKYAPDNTAPGRELGRLAAEDPKVAAASARLDDAIERYAHPEDHLQAPTSRECDITTKDFQEDVTPDPPDPSPAPAAATAVEPLAPPATSPADEGDRHEQASAGEATAATSDPVENHATAPVCPSGPEDPAQVWGGLIHLDHDARHAAKVLTDTAEATDPVIRMLRLNVQQAVEALYLYTQLHPEPSTEHPVEHPTVPSQTPVVAAPPLEQADRQPATTGTTVAPRTQKGKTGRGATTTPATTTSQRGRSGGRNNTTGKLTGHDQTIITRYQAGEPCTSISADYDCTPTAIRHLLRRNNVQLRTAGESNRGRSRPAGRVFTREQAEAIASEYATGGVSMATLAARYGSSETAIRRCLKEQGIPSRPIGTRATSTPTTATSTGEPA